MCLLNEGCTPTCIRPQGLSIVDLSWCTPDIKERISGWRVRLDLETLSDHAWIEMKLDKRDNQEYPPMQRIPRWKRNSWDFDLFRSTLEWELTGIEKRNNGGEILLDEIVGNLSKALTNSCDVAGEKITQTGKGSRRSVYWWSSELTEARRATETARRKWTNAKSRNRGRSPSEIEELRNVYRERRELRHRINKAKHEAWTELIKKLDEDPWGLGYKVVMNRL